MSNPVYYPPSKSNGVWRTPQNDKELQELCGINRTKLDQFTKFHQYIHAGETYGIVIIRNGYLAAEYYSPITRVNSLMHVYSCSKAMTSLAFGMLLEEKKQDGITLDSQAFSYIPEAFPLTDERKRNITIRQLLAMSAGFPGEHSGMPGIYNGAPKDKEVAYVLGHDESGDFAKLLYEPGTSWDYSCASYCQLSFAFQNIAGCTMAEYVKEKLLTPIGVEDAYWESFGGYGAKTYTAAEEGFFISAREFARIGYLLLQNGVWDGKQIIPSGYIKEAARSSQPFNKDYGLGFWLSTQSSSPTVPKDMYAMKGHKTNRLFIIPSQQTVIARVGMGPNSFNDDEFISGILSAVDVN